MPRLDLCAPGICRARRVLLPEKRDKAAAAQGRLHFGGSEVKLRRPGDAERNSIRRHCEKRSDEAIHLSASSAWQCGLLRGACHRARIRATRWLAIMDSGDWSGVTQSYQPAT